MFAERAYKTLVRLWPEQQAQCIPTSLLPVPHLVTAVVLFHCRQKKRMCLRSVPTRQQLTQSS